MQIQEIKSLSNPLVKHWVKVRTDSSYRKEKKSALITGSKLIAELGTKVALKALILETEAPLPAAFSQVPLLYRVPFSLLKKITGLEHPEPIAAETALPSPGKLEGKKFLLALDGVSDPGNLGTLLRTALALNWEGVFITSHSADPFNDKALRAAKGATFHLPLRMGTWEELSRLIQENQLHVYLADIKGSSPDTHLLQHRSSSFWAMNPAEPLSRQKAIQKLSLSR